MFFKKSRPSVTRSLANVRKKKREPKTTELALETLEVRAVPATIVTADSTFSPEIFGQNLMDYNQPAFVGFGYAVTDPSRNIVENASGGGGDARSQSTANWILPRPHAWKSPAFPRRLRQRPL